MPDVMEVFNRCGSCRHFVPQHTDRNGRTMGECTGRPTHPNMHAHEYGCPEYHVDRARVVPGSPIPADADLSPRQREAAKRIEATRLSQVSSRKNTERVRMVRDDDDDEAKAAAFESQELPITLQGEGGTMTKREFRGLLSELIHDAFDDALGLTDTPIHPRFRGGRVVVHPANAELQAKEMEIDVLFRKVVSIRDKLRLLEQKINASDKLLTDEKAQIHQYITGCYGSLTSFNYLFRDRDDGFVGESKG